ncbi:MAG: PrsW family intramembrane metalloprotease [Candidatus Pacebacteria bacterium]|nr:PrsW family intramembrane metalloprotease [Candidatus Paceibacterota bacterium]
MVGNIFLHILIATIPGLIWLFFFLQKDNLKEPGMQIVKVFYISMIMVFPAAMIEIYMQTRIDGWNTDSFYYLLKHIFIVGLVEESLKYLVVRYAVLKKSFLDEPIDIIIYMITSGLGFATAENILTFMNNSQFLFSSQIQNGLIVATTRFFGANLLHVLCSGIIGIFIALSFYHLKKRWWIISLGFLLSITIHGVFNFSIELFIINNNELIAILPFIITTTILVPFIAALGKIKKMKSVCKIN